MNLNDYQSFSQLDTSNAYGSLLGLPEQLRQAWEEVSSLELPDRLREVDTIAVCATGGSAFGPRIVEPLFADSLTKPFQLVSGYTLPAWVNERTLVIAISYSGGTEEVRTMAHEAQERGAQLVTIAAGGALPQEVSGVHYTFNDTRTNPAGQPRMGLGLTFSAFLCLLARLDFLSCTSEEIMDAIVLLEQQQPALAQEHPTEANPAKQLAQALQGRLTLLVSSEHLTGNTHAARNQLHETAKQFAETHAIPELNHHLMEGLAYPRALQDAIALLFPSALYHPHVQARYSITADVFTKQGLQVVEHQLQGHTRLQQSVELLHFMSYVSYYTGMLNEVNPSIIPWVDQFKAALAAKKTP